MTAAESKALKKGSRVYWRGDATDGGSITEMSWDAVTIAWDNGQLASSGALPVDHDGDPRVLLGVEAQPIRGPAPLAQPHRHVGGVGRLGHGEAGADASLRGIDEHTTTATMRHLSLLYLSK